MRTAMFLKDHDGLVGFLRQFPIETNKSVAKQNFKLANELRNNVIKAMQNTPRMVGKGYTRSKTGKTHQPSAPGNPPAVYSGNYVRKIQVERVVGGGHTFVTGVPYLKYLMTGTQNMAKRPVWGKQILAIQKKLPIKSGIAIKKILDKR